jgi:hypothetical protein
VRELELELEECKRDVRTERTRIEAKDRDIEELKRERTRKDKGKQRDVGTEKDVEERYKEVVEEKKGMAIPSI